jgi:TolB-like protein
MCVDKRVVVPAMDAPKIINFGPFQVLADRRELLSRGAPVPLSGRAFDLLLALLRRPGKVASKDELMAEVWPDSIVEENSLHVHISALRKALGEQADGPRYILTIPGRGYRFVAPTTSEVSAVSGADVAAAPIPLPDKASIAVLPFTNISGDPDQDYFADGIVEDIITALARFPSLFVIARNSSFTYKGRTVDIKQVGRELGVRYVLEGSVRKAGSRVRISGQLIQTETGAHIWAERYDSELSDVFALQDEITASVVGAIVPSLQQAEIERARRKPPESVDAYDLYLRALRLFHTFTRDSNAQALELVGRAVALDPDFLSAVILGEKCWALEFTQGWSPPSKAHAECMRYARRAVQIDGDNAEAIGTLARRMATIERNCPEARSLAEKAVALNPYSATAWRQGGYAFATCGDSEKALTHFRRAVQLSPRDPRADDAWAGIAIALIQLQRDDEAVEAARAAVQGRPNSASAWRAYSAALALTGQTSEARVAVQRLLEIDPTCSLTEMRARYGYTEEAARRYFAGMRKAGLPD